MSFPAYPDYKHSGVELLPEYPSHWTLKRFKNVFAERAERSSDGSEELLSVSAYFGVKPRSETLDEGDHLSRAESLEGYKVCRAGDLVINIMLAWNRGLGFSWQHGIVSPAYSVFHVTDGSLPKFLDYLVRSDECIRYFKTHSAGIMDSRLRLYPESFGRLFSAIPPACEQTQIARFLDHETARIDALIEEQQRLIELLKEKRQAVISHAVTKGLDPTVPMKDSGVEWLGEVPAHWEVTPLKHVVATPITDGPHETPDFIDEGVLFVSAEAVSSGRINFSKARYISRDDHLRYSRKYRPQKFDIYMVKSGATTGVTAIVETDDEFNIWSPLAVVRCKPQYSPYFVLFSMRSRNFQESVVVNWSFGTQQNIGMNVIENLPIACPPADEQKKIAAFITQESEKWDSLISEGVRAVHLLQERRSALISAAVTGKIDVRGWQPPASTQAPKLEVAEAN